MAVKVNPAFKALNLYFDYPTNAFNVDDADTGINIESVQNDIRTDLQSLKVWVRGSSWAGAQPLQSELYYDGPFQGQMLIDKLSATSTDLLEDNKSYFIKYAFISKIQPQEYTILPVTATNTPSELTGKTLDVSLPIQGYLTRDPVEIPTDENGTNPIFTDAIGQFKVFRYSEEVTTSGQVTFAIKTVNNIKITTGGADGTIDQNGNYTVTSITSLTGSITFTATWTNPNNPVNTIVIEKILNIGKRRPGQTAPLVSITASPGLAFALVENSSGTTIYPQEGITLSASTSNIPGQIQFTWTYDPGGVNLPIEGTGTNYTNGYLTHTSLNADKSELTILPAFFSGMTPPQGKAFKVVAESTVVGNDATSFDLFSIYYLKEGSDAIYMGLENENQTVTVDKNNQYIGTQPIIESQALVVEGIDFVPDNLVTYSIDSQNGFDNTLVINTAANTPTQGKPKGYIKATAIEAVKAYGIIKAVVAGKTFLKTLTVNRVKDGADAINIAIELTNDTHVIPTLPDGSGGNFTGASTTMEVYKDGVRQTTGFTFYVSELSGVGYVGYGGSTIRYGVGTVDGNLIVVDGTATVSVVALNADSGYIDITAKKTDDEQIFTRRFSLSKNKDGDASTIYELRGNTKVIAKASPDNLIDGTHTPSTINFKVYRIKGDLVEEFGGDPLYYAQWNTPDQSEPSTYTVVPSNGNLPVVNLTNSSDITSVNAKLMYKKQDGTYILLDKEEIGIVYKGSSGQAVVTSYAFIRTDSDPPQTPTGGNYSSPNPTGPANAGGQGVTWSDGIPADNGKPLWMSIRIFTSDGQAPQTSSWGTPAKVAQPSESARYEFSPNGNTDWSATPRTTDQYARLLVSTDNGITFVQSGDVIKIKGENAQGRTDSFAFIRSKVTPETPTGGSFLNPNPTGPIPAGGDGASVSTSWSDGIPAGNTGLALWFSHRIFTSDGLTPNQAVWSTPVKVTEPSESARYEFSPNGISDWSTTPRTTDQYARLLVSTDNGITFEQSGDVVKIKGEKGDPGTAVDIVFRRSYTTLTSAPTENTNPPTGWSSTVANAPGTGPIWSSIGYNTTGAANGWVWDPPIRVEGSDGLPGNTVAEVSAFLRSASEPQTPTGGSYTFGATNPLTPPTNWFATIPTGTDPIWEVRAIAAITGTSGTDNSLTWSAPVKTAQNGSDGQSINVQYSTTNSTNDNDWTSNPTGAKYIRTGTKVPPATTFTYSAGVKFVPELGVEYSVINGQTSYLHIKYSNDNGANFTTNDGETVGDYIGTYVDFVAADSPLTSSYTWVKIKGEGATVTIGGVTTGASGTNATVTNTGTTSNAILNFTIPQGNPGNPGTPAKGIDILGAVTGSFKRSAGGVYTPANTGVLTARAQNLTEPITYSWTVSGGTFANGSTSASGSVDQLVTPNDTSSMVVTLIVTSAGVSYNKTLYYSINSDGAGTPGTDGRRTATGFVYRLQPTTSDTVPTDLSADYYTFSTGVFTGGTIGSNTWSKSAPTFLANNTNRYWVATYTAVEGLSGTTATNRTDLGTGGSLTFGNVEKAVGFSGLVTFSSGTQVTDGSNTIAGFNNQTQIDGGQITTGAISAGRLQLGQNSGANRIVVTDSKIEIYDSNVLRVKIGNLG